MAKEKAKPNGLEYHHQSGPLDKRVRTDVRMSERILRVMDEQCQTLGIPKNAFFTMAACTFAVKLVPLLYGVKKQKIMFANLEKLFHETLEEARAAT